MDWTPINQYNPIDVRSNYRDIANQFVAKYYSVYDSDFTSLTSLYKPQSSFLYLGQELVGAEQFLNHLVNHHGFRSFSHTVDTVDSVPMGHKTLLINIYGSVSANGSYTSYRFVETVVLQADGNAFFVNFNTFRLI